MINKIINDKKIYNELFEKESKLHSISRELKNKIYNCENKELKGDYINKYEEIHNLIKEINTTKKDLMNEILNIEKDYINNNNISITDAILLMDWIISDDEYNSYTKEELLDYIEEARTINFEVIYINEECLSDRYKKGWFNNKYRARRKGVYESCEKYSLLIHLKNSLYSLKTNRRFLSVEGTSQYGIKEMERQIKEDLKEIKFIVAILKKLYNANL